MNWFTDKLYDLAASPRGGEGAWGELAAQDAMSPATRASYWAGSEMPRDPRIAGWRSPPRMGDTVAPPSENAWMLPPEGLVRVGAPSQEVVRRFGASGLTPPPARSEADAYRMGGMASMDEYKKAPDTAWRDIDRQAIEDQYGGADIHGIKLPPVSADEPRAWRDAIVGETPADALINWGLGGTGKLAKGALALGGLFKLADPAEAGVLSKAGNLLRGKPGGPWEGGIRAYHSSPHDFDKFDWSKLRTGEGANTYGAGFYFAENPAVSGQGGQYWSQFLHKFPKEEMRSAEWLRQHGFDREAATVELQRQIGDLQSKVKGIGSASAEDIGLKFPTAEDQRVYRDNLRHYYNDEIGKYQERLGRLQGNAPVGPRTYEVNINARPELMLDWDKPLKQQPQIVEKLPALVEGAGREAYDRALAATSKPRADELWGMAKDPLQATGEFAYGRLAPRDYNRASDMLREAGIPGIRYLDQGSRGQKYWVARHPQGGTSEYPTEAEARAFIARNPEYRMEAPQQSYNYVVTDPSKLDIMAKYGIVGGAPVGMGALAAQDQYR